MRKVSQSAELVEEVTPSLSDSRRVTGSGFRSGVAIVASKVRPQDVGITTLKQNVALVDRLRRVAIRSEPPPPMPADETLKTLDAPDADFIDTSDIEDYMPLKPIFLSKRKQPVGNAVSLSQIAQAEPSNAQDGEPITNMQPVVRRNRERQQATSEPEVVKAPQPASSPKSSRLGLAVFATVILAAAAAGAVFHHGSDGMAAGTTHAAGSR